MLRSLLAAAVATLVVIATPASVFAGKDDPEKLKEAREKVRDKYENKDSGKGGFTFYDLKYWVDVAKLEDGRWSKSAPREPKHDNGVQLIAKWANESSAVAGMTIDVLIVKLKHKEQQGSSTSQYSYPFNNLGESVRCDDVEGLANGFYEDWKRAAKDVIEDRCTAPKKSKVKVAKLEAGAVGTDKDSGERVRKEWYLWPDGGEGATYVAILTYGPALLDKDGLLEKGVEFMKAIGGIKDKVEWD